MKFITCQGAYMHLPCIYSTAHTLFRGDKMNTVRLEAKVNIAVLHPEKWFSDAGQAALKDALKKF